MIVLTSEPAGPVVSYHELAVGLVCTLIGLWIFCVIVGLAAIFRGWSDR